MKSCLITSKTCISIQLLLNNIDDAFDRIKAIKAISNIEISDFDSVTVSTYLNDVENTMSLLNLTNYEQKRNELTEILAQQIFIQIGKRNFTSNS